MRYSSFRLLSDDDNSTLQPAAMTYKLYWSAWHKSFTELGLDICGLAGCSADGPDYELDELPWRYLMARADSIYGSTN